MKKINKKQIVINTIIFVILPALINIVVESLGHKKLFGGIEVLIDKPYMFICNTLIIACTLSIGVFLRRYRYFWVVVISLVWVLLGVSNFLLLCNRVLPLTAHDLQLLDLVSAMMKKYLNPIALAAVSLGVVALLIGIIILFFKSRPPEGKRDLKKPVVFFVLVISLAYGNIKYATASGVLATRFPELSKAYLDNGFVYSFTLSLIDNGVDKVDGYSEKLINSIIEDFDATDSDKIKMPNVIFLQLESFFDVNTLNCVKFSENPIPNFTKLAYENGSGLLTVPTIGAGTVNTEFEIVTGMRIVDFGAGEYPYKTVLTDNTCESLANNLKSHGYISHFIHNYKGTFYGRNKVYANLGYDYFFGLESMSGYETNENGWPKDGILTQYINKCLDSTEGYDLVTAVSVQAHGGYGDITDFEKHITVTECDNKSARASLEYYVNQLYEVDLFLGELMTSLSERNEDIILVVYGDHLPSLDLKDSDINNRGIYQSDYFIWNNMGITYEDEDLYAYQLSSKVLASINISDGVINSCHQKYKDDKQYSYYLQALEYDILYGKKYAYDGKNPYLVSDMKKNNRTLKIYDVAKKENDEATYIVTGDGFTEKTFVRVDNLIVTTKYIDEHTLEFKWKRYQPDMPVSLWEKGVGDSESFIPKQ